MIRERIVGFWLTALLKEGSGNFSFVCQRREIEPVIHLVSVHKNTWGIRNGGRNLAVVVHATNGDP